MAGVSVNASLTRHLGPQSPLNVASVNASLKRERFADATFFKLDLFSKKMKQDQRVNPKDWDKLCVLSIDI